MVEAYNIREDAQHNNFSATPIKTARALGALMPGVQSHHAQTFVVAPPLTASNNPSRRTAGGHGAPAVLAKVSPPLTATGVGAMRTGNEWNDLDFCIPIDTRNALRDPDKRDKQNWQGCGTGEDGDPAPTLTDVFVPAVAHAVRTPSGGIDREDMHTLVAQRRVEKVFHLNGDQAHSEVNEDIAGTLNCNIGNRGGCVVKAFTIMTCDGGKFRRKDRPNGGMYVREVDTSLTVGSPNQAIAVHTYDTPAIGGIRESRVSRMISANTGGGGETQNPAFIVERRSTCHGSHPRRRRS